MVAISISAAPPPADEFSSFARQVSQLVDRELGQPYFGFSQSDAFRPAVNLYETREAFMICVDLAGMDQKDIEVSLEKGSILIRGRRQSPMPPDGSRAVAVHLMEIDHGAFCRSVEIPESVNAETIAAHYHLGMLWIVLPKTK